jgi:hypothetical protein
MMIMPMYDDGAETGAMMAARFCPGDRQMPI